MGVGLAQLFERPTVELAEVHFAQIVEQDWRVPRQRTDRLGGPTGADQRTGIQRLDVAVLSVEVVGQPLDLVLAARTQVRVGPDRQAHADVVFGLRMAYEQQGGGGRTGLELHRTQVSASPANAVIAAPSSPASSPKRDATMGTTLAAPRICLRAISVAHST